MSSSFSNIVRTAFGKLISSYGFKIVEDQHDSSNFGNAVVVLDSSDFRIRLVKDRDQIFGEVASYSEPETWYGIDRLYEVINLKPIPKQSGSIDDIVAAIEKDLVRIEHSLHPMRFSATKKELERIGELAKQAMLKRFQSKP